MTRATSTRLRDNAVRGSENLAHTRNDPSNRFIVPPTLERDHPLVERVVRTAGNSHANAPDHGFDAPGADQLVISRFGVHELRSAKGQTARQRVCGTLW